MKFRYIILFFAAVASVAISCSKDEDDDTTYESFDGTMYYELPAYVHYGETYHLEPSGVSRSDDYPDNIGYTFYNSLYATTDTLRYETDPVTVPASCDFTIGKDTLGTFTATYAAYASGFYRNSLTRTFTIIKAGFNAGSIMGINFADGTYQFTDSRDGREYYAVDIDGTSWMCENLAYAGAGQSYLGESPLDDLFGRFYTYADTQKPICPDGWTVPTDNDWVALANKFSSSAAEVSPNDVKGAAGCLMADAYYNTEKMWEYWPSVNLTNKSGLSVMPLGYGTIAGAKSTFSGFNSYAVFWTADGGADYGLSRYIYLDKDILFAGQRDKNDFLANVRCIKK